MLVHDFVKYPELSNSQMQVYQFSSPHKQITEDFMAEVVKVHDGDTITVNCDFRDFSFPVRLLDIDAREMSEGGLEAREWLKERILGKEVSVLINPVMRVGKYGRLLGKVFCGGLDVGQEMLSLGLVKLFGSKSEGLVPDINKTFRLGLWL